MIDPITGTALIDVLEATTAAMAGQTLADAYNSRMDNTLHVGEGISVGYGNENAKTPPAISGDTNGSIKDNTSESTDPLISFNYYTNNNTSSVNSTTGGVEDGSYVRNYSYSILNTAERLHAVSPVRLATDTALLAIATGLGTAMSLKNMDDETKDILIKAAFTSDTTYAGFPKDVAAWTDGKSIYVPRATIKNVFDAMTANGVPVGGAKTNQAYTSESISVVQPIEFYNTITYKSTVKKDQHNDEYFRTQTLTGARIAPFGSGQVANWFLFASMKPTTVIDTSVTTYIKATEKSHTDSHEHQVAYSFTHDGRTVYYGGLQEALAGSTVVDYVTPNLPRINGLPSDEKLVAWTMVYGNVTINDYPGGTKASGGRIYTPTSWPSAGSIATSPHSGIDAVRLSIPSTDDTFDYTGDPDSESDPNVIDRTKPAPIPVPIPDTNVSNPDIPLVNPTVVDSTLVDALVEELATTLDPQAPQSSGLVPFPVLPGGGIDPSTGEPAGYPSIVPASGSGLIHVYNPTNGEMVSFGNWLWVTYADASIEKIWNNPFDGIIGAFEIYITPQTDGADNIRSGFLTCPTTAALVRQRYVEIDCGSIIVPEFYGNYLDYSPYSQAYIYLPFIGINEVSIDDIVGHAINIRYRVDTYNGSCIAMIYVAKHDYRNLCYQFGGNCAVEVPLAGGSQAAIRAGMMQSEAYARATIQNAGIGAIGSLVGGIGSLLGGSLGGALSGATNAVTGYLQGSNTAGAQMEAARVANKSSVQHSGTFGASHGAMGLKVPQIIIRNPIQVKVVNYNNDYGFPAHKRVIIGGCTGYLRVKEVNVLSATATDEEKIAIEMALKNGVYVS